MILNAKAAHPAWSLYALAISISGALSENPRSLPSKLKRRTVQPGVACEYTALKLLGLGKMIKLCYTMQVLE